MNQKNIVLVGMPGAGKSTVGVLLAKAMKMPFADTDLLIQEKEDQALQDIIDTAGLEQFLKIEERVILELTYKGHVIATGGSVVYSEAAMRHLKDHGVVVYLELPYLEVEQRINNITTRGIAMGPGESLLDIYKQRVPLYEKHADITVSCTGSNMEEVVEKIIRAL